MATGMVRGCDMFGKIRRAPTWLIVTMFFGLALCGTSALAEQASMPDAFIEPAPVSEAPAKKEQAPAPKGTLTVNARPEGVWIRIMNIVPKYSRGMSLAPGKYRVRGRKKGYETKDVWVTIKPGEKKVVALELTKTPEKKQTAKATQSPTPPAKQTRAAQAPDVSPETPSPASGEPQGKANKGVVSSQTASKRAPSEPPTSSKQAQSPMAKFKGRTADPKEPPETTNPGGMSDWMSLKAFTQYIEEMKKQGLAPLRIEGACRNQVVYRGEFGPQPHVWSAIWGNSKERFRLKDSVNTHKCYTLKHKQVLKCRSWVKVQAVWVKEGACDK